ncbi:MAG TPA: methyltransferase domain-containing protein [Pyrinomonadaceae bacterium]|jgi:O-antigen chain-terminating methyltransferase
MIETDDSEINIDLLMAKIREAANARRAGNGTSLIDASAVLHDLLKSNGKSPAPVHISLSESTASPQSPTSQPSPLPPLVITGLRLQPEFEPRDDDHYHVNDLLGFHDLEFVRNAYRAILKREPDDAGLVEYLSNLRGGRFNKIDVLASLRFSPEGKARGVRIDALSFPAFLRRLYRVPALGYLLELTVGLFRLPLLLRSQRQLEAYSVAQDERLAGHLNLMNARLADAVSGYGAQWAQELSEVNGRLTEDLSRVNARQFELAEEFSRIVGELSANLGELSESYKKVTGLQHQQLGALFREQQEIVEDQKRLRADLHAYLGAEQERARRQAEAQEKYDERLTHAGAQYETVVEYIDTRVGQVAQKLQQTRTELVLHERRLTLLLEEARKRLQTESFTPAELQTFAREERHVLDALYTSFEDQFRGSREDIKERFRIYVPFLKDAAITSAILDIGCGRGEWLEVLKDEGIEARGVELNRAMVDQCSERGLEVSAADAVTYLQGLPPESLRAVTGFHFIEHLPFETLIKLLDEIVRVLKRGGLVIFETPNPENVLVGSYYFYFDPTHRNPLPDAMTQFLLESRGLSRIEVIKLHPADALRVEGDDELTERFNQYFFGPMDYAVIGRKL